MENGRNNPWMTSMWHIWDESCVYIDWDEVKTKTMYNTRAIWKLSRNHMQQSKSNSAGQMIMWTAGVHMCAFLNGIAFTVIWDATWFGIIMIRMRLARNNL